MKILKLTTSALLLSLFGFSGLAMAAPDILISAGPDGQPAGGLSHKAAIAGNGKSVCFISSANNLVENDTNERYDVFLWDAKTKSTQRLSVSETGEQSTDDSEGGCAVSNSGRYVAFETGSSNIHPDLLPGGGVIVVDITTGQRKAKAFDTNLHIDHENYRVFAISDDGKTVLFTASAVYEESQSEFIPAVYKWQFFLWNHETDTLTTITKTPDGALSNEYGYGSSSGHMTMKGNMVYFPSRSTNLVNPPLVNQGEDWPTRYYSYDVKKGKVSLLPDPLAASLVTPDGSKVFKTVWEDGLYVRPINKKAFKLLKKMPNEILGPSSASKSGKYLVMFLDYVGIIMDTHTKQYKPFSGDEGELSRDGKSLVYADLKYSSEEGYTMDLYLKRLTGKADK
jgi:hypothetical protein